MSGGAVGAAVGDCKGAGACSRLSSRVVALCCVQLTSDPCLALRWHPVMQAAGRRFNLPGAGYEFDEQLLAQLR